MALYYTDNDGNKIKVAGSINGNGLPLGFIFSSTCVLNDACFHLADGSLISQTGIYAQFVTWLKARINENSANVPTCTQSEFDNEVATYGQCGKFVIDDTAGTIRLPKITEFVASNNGGQDIGSAQIDEFKSHRHELETAGLINTAYSGKTGWAVTSNNSTSSGGDVLGRNTDNAGGIETRPKNVRYPVYIVMGSYTKTPTQVNLDNIVEDLNNKADKDLSNVTKINWNVINSTSTSVIIPISWDTVKEFYFRVLGGDDATFGYLYLPKEAWHNNGTYGALLNCIDQNFQSQGSALFSVSNKTSNSIQINMTANGTDNKFMVGYR